MQAVIITAYHNLQQTYELASMLAKKFEIYIHIDKKIPKKEIEQSGLYKIKNIRIFNKFKVNWGGGKSSLVYSIYDKRGIKKCRYKLFSYNIGRGLAC